MFRQVKSSDGVEQVCLFILLCVCVRADCDSFVCLLFFLFNEIVFVWTMLK